VDGDKNGKRRQNTARHIENRFSVLHGSPLWC